MEDKVCKCGEHIYKEAVNVDQSLPVLTDLLANGYTTVKWISSTMACQKCRNLDGQIFVLSEFIGHVEHSAPIFETKIDSETKSHPNCTCHIEVSGDGKETILLDWRGIINL